MLCKARTRDNYPCTRQALVNGYCLTHYWMQRKAREHQIEFVCLSCGRRETVDIKTYKKIKGICHLCQKRYEKEKRMEKRNGKGFKK